jgi:hypothetical protein
MSFVLSLLFIFFLLPSRSIQASYSIQAILPLSQTDDPDHFAQWAKAAKLAAAQVSASWAPSNSLYVDVLDYLNDELTLQMIGSAAMLNSSVLGVISDELGSRMLSGSAANFDVCTLTFTGCSLEIFHEVHALGYEVIRRVLSELWQEFKFSRKEPNPGGTSASQSTQCPNSFSICI